jgi:hypothetical protein
MKSRFSGKLHEGTVIQDMKEDFFAEVGLHSSVFNTNKEYFDPLKSPQYSIPDPIKYSEGVFFYAEVGEKFDDPSKFMAVKCETIGNNRKYKAHLITNDADYVREHDNIEWK